MGSDYVYPLYLSMALRQLPYRSLSASELPPINCDNILLSDSVLTSEQIKHYIDWVERGGNLVVFTFSSIKTFNLFGLNETGNYLSANSIIDNTGGYNKIPEISVPQIEFNDNYIKVIADYAFENNPVSPFAFMKDFGKGKIIYIELIPLLDLGGSQYLEIINWIFGFLKDNIYMTSSDIIAYTRDFYVKNIGEISLNGEINVKINLFLEMFKRC